MEEILVNEIAPRVHNSGHHITIFTTCINFHMLTLWSCSCKGKRVWFSFFIKSKTFNDGRGNYFVDSESRINEALKILPENLYRCGTF